MGSERAGDAFDVAIAILYATANLGHLYRRLHAGLAADNGLGFCRCTNGAHFDAFGGEYFAPRYASAASGVHTADDNAFAGAHLCVGNMVGYVDVSDGHSRGAEHKTTVQIAHRYDARGAALNAAAYNDIAAGAERGTGRDVACDFNITSRFDSGSFAHRSFDAYGAVGV